MRIISKILSGGQTGVDVAALRAAKARGIPTGGTMPKGWRTLDGPRPEYRELYGMVECAISGYPPRTKQNVKESDITVRIGTRMSSAGELCTWDAISMYERPYFDVLLLRTLEMTDREYALVNGAALAMRTLAFNLKRPIIVNFAGNSERTAPGIEVAAETFVGMILDAFARSDP